MQKLKVHLKISSVANPSMAARCPNGDLPMIIGFLGVRRRPAGAPPVTTRPPADCRRGIAWKFCHLQSESGGRRTVAWRWPADVRCLTFTTWFKVEKNPAMICRCQKTGIGEKSGDHSRIYKACEVGIREQDETYINSSRWSTLVELKPKFTRMWVARSAAVLWKHWLCWSLTVYIMFHLITLTWSVI